MPRQQEQRARMGEKRKRRMAAVEGTVQEQAARGKRGRSGYTPNTGEQILQAGMGYATGGRVKLPRYIGS